MRAATGGFSRAPFRNIMAPNLPAGVGSQVDVHDAVQHEVIQAQLQIESTRRENEFKALGDSIPQIVWTATADGWIDWYNRKWYDYTGQTVAEAAGWGWQSVHHPEDFPEVMRAWPKAIADGDRFEMEFRLRGADGTFRWFLTRVDPYRDDGGTIVRWFGTNTDVDDQKREVEKTRRIAETLQRVFLPDRLPARENLWFDAIYLAAERDAQVGGDWYDAFDLNDGRVVISIGDVAGHGLEAAVVAGKLRQIIFAEALYNHDPATVLIQADIFLRGHGDTIATALVAILEPASGEMTYATAGHPSPIVSTPGKPAHNLTEGGAPLGTGNLVDGPIAHRATFTVPDDALVVFYTDGITEFDRNALAGEARLRSACEGRHAERCRDLRSSDCGIGPRREPRQRRHRVARPQPLARARRLIVGSTAHKNVALPLEPRLQRASSTNRARPVHRRVGNTERRYVRRRTRARRVARQHRRARPRHRRRLDRLVRHASGHSRPRFGPGTGRHRHARQPAGEFDGRARSRTLPHRKTCYQHRHLAGPGIGYRDIGRIATRPARAGDLTAREPHALLRHENGRPDGRS